MKLVMKHIYFTLLLWFISVALHAQDVTHERAYVHLDKDCYIAGESILAKFYLTDNSFQPSDLSRVGYIEISDTERPHIQHKVALENGRGAVKMEIPQNTPSGVYQLTAYTRFMRNEGEKVFFKRELAIVNMTQDSRSDRISLSPKGNAAQAVSFAATPVKLSVDKETYKKRETVKLSIDKLPADISDLVISVVRDDSLTQIPSVDHNAWKSQVTGVTSNSTTKDWVAEYEGHIITGQIIPTTNTKAKDYGFFVSSIGFVGKDIRFMLGNINKTSGKVSYYTEGIYGKQDLVTSVLENRNPTANYRVDLVSPFAEVLPTELSPLQINPENNKLIDRFIGMQLNQIMIKDSTDRYTPMGSLYNLTPVTTYDLDEYTRFNSVRQTITEFILRLVVRKIDGENRIKVFFEKEKRFNSGSTLVLLDGVPLYNHDLILNYNPFLIKRIDIYDNKYSFGGDFYDCMVAFTTYKGNLPSIQLGDEAQLFVYDCPELPSPFCMPDYSDVQTKKSSRPDFRHTLYWEPLGEYKVNKNNPVLFYTSDLTGRYKIVVEGITKEGNMVTGNAYFNVNEN